MSDDDRIVMALVCALCNAGPWIGGDLQRHLAVEHGIPVPFGDHYRVESYRLSDVLESPADPPAGQDAEAR